MNHLPLPVRIAVGLIATAVEQTRALPRRAVELPVAAVSQALQMSMRIQQKVTELAIKGDTVLSRLRPVEENPSWARFDDEEPDDHHGTGSLTDLRPARERRERPGRTQRPMTEDRGSGAAAGDRVRTAATTPPGTRARRAGERATRAGDAAGPDVLPGYPQLTVPQLRGRLRHLSLNDLQTLLEWEKAHENRPVYVTMLTNRIATVTGR